MRRLGTIIATFAWLTGGLMAGPMTAGAGWAGEVRSLVIGVDDYLYERKLRGSVNDAQVIAEALKPIASDRNIRVLLNREVRRDAVLTAMEDVLRASHPEDTIVLTYSGHGARERMPVSTAHPLGFRQFWVMSDFDRRNEEGKRQRVMSAEISAWLDRARAAKVKVVLLADHCFAGTIYRSIGVDAPNVRSIPLLVSPDVKPGEMLPDLSETEAAPLPPGVTSLAADRSDRSVAEFRIRTDDRMHGALSFAFAHAIGTDIDVLDPSRGGRVTRGALLNYLQQNVTTISDGAQEPQLRPVDPEDEVLFVVPTRGATDARPPPPGKGAEGPFAAVPMHVSGLPAAEGRAIVEAIPGAVWESDPGMASLTWQVRTGESARLVTALNMVVSFDSRREDLAMAVGTVQIVGALGARAATAGVARSRGFGQARPSGPQSGLQSEETDPKAGAPGEEVSSRLRLLALTEVPATGGNASLAAEYRTRGITPRAKGGDRTAFLEGEQAAFRLEGLPGPNVVMVNIANDGTVQYVYPGGRAGPVAWPTTRFDIAAIPVLPPFGGDHMVVVASPRPLKALEAGLRALDGRRDPAAARAAIENALTADPTARLAVKPVFTVPAKFRCDPEFIRDAARLAACAR